MDDKYVALLKARYRRARKTERSVILDEYVRTTGHNRKYAIGVLTGKRRKGQRLARRSRRVKYGAEEAQPLLILSDLFDHIGSKRLRVALDNELRKLYEDGALQISASCYQKLCRVSPATMDRLLVGRRPQLSQSRGFTKPGTLLKHHIPVRTWADWTEDRPGFAEMDLVDHSGGRVIRGADHAWTLCFTDVHTAWTECAAVPNKAQVHVFTAIQRVRQRLPFALLGIDSDNGSEFINDQLYRYCLREQITFTRSREGHKNDSAYAEQKNWSVVRRAVGSLRYDTAEQLELLHRLYALWRLYVNFFLPVMKLKEKTRSGSKVKRTYDRPQTPYARVMASPHVPQEAKSQLAETYAHLNLVQLREQIVDLQRQLFDSTPAR
jgi:hypothetical protein